MMPALWEKVRERLLVVLRHIGERLGLRVSPGGWVFIKELQLKIEGLSEVTAANFEAAVCSDPGKKFEIAYVPDSEKVWRDVTEPNRKGKGGVTTTGRVLVSGGIPLAIRAKQGHSMGGIDPAQVFSEIVTLASYQRRMGKPITDEKVFHATNHGCCETICRIGIYPGGLGSERRAIYLSPVKPDTNDDAYLLGVRSDAPYVIEMDLELVVVNAT